MYKAVDLARCRNLKHRFRCIGSEKTPMKLSLVCLDESIDGITAMAAHGFEEAVIVDGREIKSFGIWKRKRDPD